VPEGEAAFAEMQAEAGQRFVALSEALGPQNLEVLRALVYFAEITAQTPTAHETALARFREAEAGFRPLYGDGAPTLAALRLKEGTLLEKMGRGDEALAAYEGAIRRLGRGLDQHPIRAELLIAMGDRLAADQQRDRAVPLWDEAARILAVIYGPDHPRVQRLRDRLIN
jgi:tetratricopeptide (TPR) repeat protein